MSTYTFDLEYGGVRLDVNVGHETIYVEGYEKVIILGHVDDWEIEDYEPEEKFLTHEMRYSGYTLSECLCAALIAMGRADDWQEAIEALTVAGIEYRPSE